MLQNIFCPGLDEQALVFFSRGALCAARAVESGVCSELAVNFDQKNLENLPNHLPL
jgi:hypothetical protein